MNCGETLEVYKQHTIGDSYGTALTINRMGGGSEHLDSTTAPLIDPHSPLTGLVDSTKRRYETKRTHNPPGFRRLAEWQAVVIFSLEENIVYPAIGQTLRAVFVRFSAVARLHNKSQVATSTRP